MDLSYNSNLAGAGSKETIRAGDLDQDTLKQDTEVTVYQHPVADDQRLYHGYGVRDSRYATGFVGLDLVASGNGAGAVGDAIQGDVILAITDSEGKRVLSSVTFESLEELRDSLAESRSERRVEPAMAPFARPGRNLEIRVDADAASDGVEIDPDASSGKLYYGKIQG